MATIDTYTTYTPTADLMAMYDTGDDTAKAAVMAEFDRRDDGRTRDGYTAYARFAQQKRFRPSMAGYLTRTNHRAATFTASVYCPCGEHD